MPAADKNADLTLQLRGGYYFGQLERLIRDLQPLLHLKEPKAVEIDLQKMVFIGPTGTALLLATANRLGELGCGVRITPPSNPLTYRYLLRSDFVRLFTSSEYPEPFLRKAPKGFRPCAHFTTDEECTRVSRELSDALIERAPTDAGARGAIKTALHELAENVIFHADTPSGGYAAAAYSRKRHEIEMGIVDLGIGIRASLSKNPALGVVGDDVSAVQKAMIPTISSTPERNSGYGLAFTQLLLLFNGGSLRIRSGHGAAVMGPGIDYSARPDHLPGTLVVLRARTDQPLDASRAWKGLMKEIKRVVANGGSDGSQSR
jgi:hypothetical protein